LHFNREFVGRPYGCDARPPLDPILLHLQRDLQQTEAEVGHR
jgi:hypothetical protein